MTVIGKVIDRTYQYLDTIHGFELYYKDDIYYLAKEKLVMKKSQSEFDLRLDAEVLN